MISVNFKYKIYLFWTLITSQSQILKLNVEYTY